ncbi:hypothetical protein PAXRUDRAFT_821186 [Paxillus rubicundulus Ve08.2h10]|uniref:Uncharacterized protein n=1 Tax=Paxillus rubicundulus Ve08.2h10 TaxID=930991 RepID=A0A0D0E6U4_9AGAM|nr:hypothetical protein PAXRUDRAFT_821186 [Paxillus rubicundulus Ve08.2h10]
MHSSSVARSIIYIWMTLLAMAALAASSPMPEPAPIDPALSSVITSNLNLGCINGCDAAASAQKLNSNAALASAGSPLSLFGAVVLAGGVLAAI